MAVLDRLIIMAIVAQVAFSQDSNDVTTDEKTASEENNGGPTVSARIITEAKHLQIPSGQRIDLPCEIVDLDESGGVVVWKKGGKAITNGMKKIGRGPNYRFEPAGGKFDLVVKKATDADAGEYTCEVQQEVTVELTHTVTISYPPSVDIEPHENVEHSIGDTFDVKCVINGHPFPKINWMFKALNEELKELSQFVNQSNIHMDSLSRSDAGEYTCVADNGVGIPVNASMRIIMKYKPEFMQGPGLVLSKLGGEAKLECSFSAYPLEGSTAAWHRLDPAGDVPEGTTKTDVQNDDRRTITTENKDSTVHTTLAITNVMEEDFRKYICSVDNKMGSESHEVELSGFAHPENIHPVEKHPPLKYGVRMRVKSISPVKEYRIIYREYNETHEGQLQNITIVEDGKEVRTEDGDVKVYEKTYVFEDLRPMSNYSIKMMAHNDYGWSKETDLHKFFLDDGHNGAASAQGGRGWVTSQVSNENGHQCTLLLTVNPELVAALSSGSKKLDNRLFLVSCAIARPVGTNQTNRGQFYSVQRGSASRSWQNIYGPLAVISALLAIFSSWRTLDHHVG